MRALFFDGKKLLLSQRARATPAPGEALIRVTHAGICSTDLEITRGYMQFRGVLGHEFVGVVEECAKETLLNQRVVGEINCGCGHCQWCLSKDPRHCPNRTVLGILGRDGAFAEYVCLPEDNLYKVPQGVSDESAVLVEPLAACFEMLEQVHIRPDDRLIVLGDGRLAQLAARVMRLTAADLLVVGKHPNKLELLNKVGVNTQLISEFTPQSAADIVLEATGNPDGFALAMQTVAPRGVIILKSTYAIHPQVDLAQIVVKEITVIGSRCGRFGPAIRALEAGLVSVEELVSGVFSLEDWKRAFEIAKYGALKVLFAMEQQL